MEMPGQNAGSWAAWQCAGLYFLFNSWSSANTFVYKDLSHRTGNDLELTVALALC